MTYYVFRRWDRREKRGMSLHDVHPGQCPHRRRVRLVLRYIHVEAYNGLILLTNWYQTLDSERSRSVEIFEGSKKCGAFKLGHQPW